MVYQTNVLECDKQLEVPAGICGGPGMNTLLKTVRDVIEELGSGRLTVS
jgi:hypothetical protein